MMNIDPLETAILNKDPDGVVAALSQWDERQREAAREPLNILMLALGMDEGVLKPCDLKSNHPDILAKAAKANAKILAEHQARWAGLVADSQAPVAGFAVQQLAKIQKAALLDAEEAITALPNIFSHKPKSRPIERLPSRPHSKRVWPAAVG